jgi:hypothetical protein
VEGKGDARKGARDSFFFDFASSTKKENCCKGGRKDEGKGEGGTKVEPKREGGGGIFSKIFFFFLFEGAFDSIEACTFSRPE